MARYIAVGEPLNRSEEQGLRILRDELPENYIVLGNFEIDVHRRRNSLEFDALVLGDYGVWAVEIKGWGGKIIGDPRSWVLRWGRVPNPFQRIEQKAKAVRDVLVRSIHSWPRGLFCLSTVLLTGSKLNVSLTDPRADRILTDAASVRAFFVDNARELYEGDVVVSDELKARIVDELVPRVQPTSPFPVVPNYELREELDSGELPYREFFAAHRLLRTRGRVRIKAYSMDRLLPQRRHKAVVDRALRDMEALNALEQNPYVARAWELVRDLEDEYVIYIALEWVSSYTLRDWIDSLDEHARAERWSLAFHMLNAATYMHERGIVHRNLHPGVVYLCEEEGVPLKIADFDFARVANFESIDDALPTQLGEETYRAPELIMDDEEYDHRADIFSLGAILYEMVTERRLVLDMNELLDPAGTWTRLLSGLDDPDLASVLTRMMSVAPEGRDGALRDAIALCRERAGASA